MGWIVGLLPPRQVALRISAICRRNLQVVIIVDMASRARSCRVAERQWESRRIVIKIRGVPALGGMAIRAIRHTKNRARSRVRRVRRLLPCC